MDSLGHQYHAKKLSAKIALHFKVLCESKATLPIGNNEFDGSVLCTNTPITIHFVYYTAMSKYGVSYYKQKIGYLLILLPKQVAKLFLARYLACTFKCVCCKVAICIYWLIKIYIWPKFFSLVVSLICLLCPPFWTCFAHLISHTNRKTFFPELAAAPRRSSSLVFHG